MRELPTGTVTFLFTDIEGSTRLLEELGDAYRGVQNDHDRILRAAIADAEGVEVRTEGDAFFVVFRTPGQGLRAAVAAQRGLAGHAWPNGRSVRARMGLHTGEGVLGGDDYLGLDVNRAARIGATGHGGQIVLSEPTRAMVEHALPDGVTIRPLGSHRLKDLAHAEHLYDLVIEGLPETFPPLRTLEVPTSLPGATTSFVGRERDIATARDLLSTNRLLTLTGPGGTGKTRLAVRVATDSAADFPDGVWFVDLSPVVDPGRVIPEIAATLGIREGGWERPIHESLEDHLRERTLLLVLDNFEQILDAANEVARLLAAAPGLTVLVTSRAPLRVRGEQSMPLAPLDLPQEQERANPATVMRNDAVVLFAQRAAAVAPDFALTDENVGQVAEICARLDGLPLALELAASRAAVLTPSAMLDRFERGTTLTTSGPRDAPARQRTLRSTIGWSYDLLQEDERVLFRRLAVMAGGATESSAAAVCRSDGEGPADILECLSSLVESSLVQPNRTGADPRFGMLRTIREFGLERLDAEDDRAAIERRHAGWFLRLAEEAEAQYRGPDLFLALEGLEAEHDNLRAALRWATDRDEGEVALRLVGALWRFWHLSGFLSEGRRWVEEALVLPSAAGRTAARARALAGAGGLAYWQNDVPALRAAYEEALSISWELDDPAGIAEGTYNLSFAHSMEGDMAGAHELLRECRRRFEELGDRRGLGDSLCFLSLLARLEGDLDTARTQADESLRLHLAIGDAFGTIDAWHVLGRSALEQGDLETAHGCFVEVLQTLGSVGYRTGIAISLDSLASEEMRRGRPGRALRLAGASDALKEAARGQAPPELIDLQDPREAASGTLTEEQIAREWAAGRAMNLAEILVFATEETEEPA